VHVDLYTLVHAPRERHEDLLHDLIAPLAREVAARPEIDSLFFARYSIPNWQLRFRVLGERSWIEGSVRGLVQRRLAALGDGAGIERCEFSSYVREVERYGGEEGMRLAEQFFHHDSLTCLELLEAERRGELVKSRREISLLLTERLLDLLRFDHQRRIAFYEFGYRWVIERDEWTEEQKRALDRRYEELRDGLVALLDGSAAAEADVLWGGAHGSRIAGRWLESVGPVIERMLEAHSAGRIERDPVNLAWSLTHMHCNRLGIDAMPEAILRYFMHRLYLESDSKPPFV
jgi:thiopeptide-type bacteriocin biosynthesis protein